MIDLDEFTNSCRLRRKEPITIETLNNNGRGNL